MLLLITLLIGAWGILLLYRGARRAFSAGWPCLLSGLAVSGFIYLFGTWVFLSVYVRYAFATLGLLAFLLARYRSPKYDLKPCNRGPNLLLTVLFGTLCVLYYTGSTGKAEKVSLQFPLKRAQYSILQGGKGLPSNLFHYSYRGAVFAIDIVRLDRYGRRASTIFSDQLQDYHIFRDTVYSPCSGRIGRVREDNPDNMPPDRTRGPSNTNQVLIKNDSMYVFLAHLKHKGVLVKEGDVVRTGQPLALVGNSGFSLEPHLHIQAHKKTGRGPWYQEPPLYIQFDGRAYRLFEIVRPKRVDMIQP